MAADAYAQAQFSCPGALRRAAFLILAAVKSKKLKDCYHGFLGINEWAAHLTKRMAGLNVLFMRAGSKINHIGVVFLALLMLFLSTGNHDWESHIPVLGAAARSSQDFVSIKSEPDDSSTDCCNACFLTRLLNQAIFPILGEPEIAETFHKRVCLSPTVALFPALEREVNRGPPQASLFK